MWNKLSNSTLNGEIEHTKCTQWDSISIKFKGRKKKMYSNTSQDIIYFRKDCQGGSEGTI